MKKLLTVILAVLMLVPAAAYARKKQAEIKFDEYSYNFGTIPEKGGNLVIVDATADCGCTVPSYPEKPVAPGRKGAVKVTFNPLYRPGAFTKVVTVRTNSKQKKVRLKITGTVNPNK